jgi:hypothetical protein
VRCRHDPEQGCRCLLAGAIIGTGEAIGAAGTAEITIVNGGRHSVLFSIRTSAAFPSAYNS